MIRQGSAEGPLALDCRSGLNHRDGTYTCGKRSPFSGGKNEKEPSMRGMIVLTALAGLTLASPALAEDIYVGGRAGGVGVGVDVGPGYDRGYREREDYN